MTYIKLEDVKKLIKRSKPFHYAKDAVTFIEKEINSLSSINPESMIEEMIEEIKQKYRFKGIKEVGFEEVEEAVLDDKKIILLEKILKKFKS